MKPIIVAIKELQLLAGDRSGLLVLFVMPAILVVVITLVQENVMRLTGQDQTVVLYLDLDQGPVGASLAERLSAAGLTIVTAPDRATSAAVREAVTGGDYRIGIVIPAGTSDLFEQESSRLFRGLTGRDSGAGATEIAVPVFFDPAIMASLRSRLSTQVETALAALTIDRQLGHLQALLAGKTTGDNSLAELFDQPLFSLAGGDMDEGTVQRYNPVQQNVPAWALFGMFFTAIPIGGGLLKERSSGIWLRLMSLPVSPLTLVGGKILAYLVICCCQFLLICLIGATLFPLLGLPAFTVSGSVGGVAVTVLFVGLAACAFGIVLGAICSSYEQASTLGATSVVVAAALGGVMVPVYAMPPVMQHLSIISPLNWGLTALHDILVRGAGLSAVLGNLGLLLAFTVLALALACRFLPGRS